MNWSRLSVEEDKLNSAEEIEAWNNYHNSLNNPGNIKRGDVAEKRFDDSEEAHKEIEISEAIRDRYNEEIRLRLVMSEALLLCDKISDSGLRDELKVLLAKDAVILE